MGRPERVWIVAKRGVRPAQHDDPECRSFKGSEVKDISRESAERAGFSRCRYCCKEERGVVV